MRSYKGMVRREVNRMVKQPGCAVSSLMLVVILGLLFHGALAGTGTIPPPKGLCAKGEHNKHSDELVARAYPKCAAVLDADWSGATGMVMTYLVTLPDGGTIRPMYLWVSDPGQEGLPNAAKSGHYKWMEHISELDWADGCAGGGD